MTKKSSKNPGGSRVAGEDGEKKPASSLAAPDGSGGGGTVGRSMTKKGSRQPGSSRSRVAGEKVKALGDEDGTGAEGEKKEGDDEASDSIKLGAPKRSCTKKSSRNPDSAKDKVETKRSRSAEARSVDKDSIMKKLSNDLLGDKDKSASPEDDIESRRA
jgi:hypothetical protein